MLHNDNTQCNYTFGINISIHFAAIFPSKQFLNNLFFCMQLSTMPDKSPVDTEKQVMLPIDEESVKKQDDIRYYS